MLENYLPIAIVLTIAALFGLFMSKVNEWFGPKNPTQEKSTTYESGMEPIRSAHERFSVKFFLVAMLFIIFDIEIVFLYPWAVNFRELGLFGFVEMFVFLGILMIGFLYIWKKGALKWD
jgi:NADH-quinone oxidoreductase subunit A